MFISIWVSRLEIAEFPDSVRRYRLHKSDLLIVVGWAGKTKRCLTSCGVVPQSEACIFLDSALLGAHESTISGFYLSEGRTVISVCV